MIQWTELIVFTVLFLVVTVMGFLASRWQRGDTLDHLDEWGLGGRRFGAWITWFLVGGDLYTAYTFVAVPALLFGAGAMGFFALPYTVVLYPLVFLPVLRLWSVSRVHGYVTPADFVRGRYGSSLLAFIVAITGLLATMPYIALQLVGLEAVLRTMGLNGSGLLGHLPLLVAFVILAVYTYQSGLRAPALIAFVKDILIYVVILVAIVYLPSKFGGWGAIFDAADAKFQATESTADGVLLTANNQLQYITLALGSALALFLYPHSLTGILASRGRNVIKRNMMALPAYSLLLGLLALLGYVAIAAGVTPITNNATGRPDTNTIIPVLFDNEFGSLFAGLAFAAIGIGALVPAAIMSIAAANLWTRNIYKEYLRKDATPKQEAQQAKIASLVVKFGAVLFIVAVDPQFSIDLQLIGGVIILQTLPAVAIAVYTRWLHRWALVAGWVVGMGYGLHLLYTIPNPAAGRAHFGGSALALDKINLLGWQPFAGSTALIYVGFVALVLNLVVAVLVTFALRAAGTAEGDDQTSPADYHADEGSDRLKPVAADLH
ncbi:sodium:solute symporter [Pseudonocardia sp. KRD-184]|uniref:Sodium:solute symporter n=1 Tax=Pseudonocardia oceani TaxID=2792013 RepID=A0ABS6UAC7_9PSEU|nr:sodium:solute symporter [Pseudonocardia oceani]MBW0089743.1 sodium:solute symporter [Pseudonocardia oceani]MBW0095229.1 sodium:solute symporter [Pseudonocardia oceani]MBW0107723.1 sodium:solute symporter [Pseudonocardia oceani]MBW0121724.1 sodium:solute symporter [Pseudonocardia oceani]MBW0129189.1 sodium:solute symporter [Pseudonocardia oceani]